MSHNIPKSKAAGMGPLPLIGKSERQIHALPVYPSSLFLEQRADLIIMLGLPVFWSKRPAFLAMER
jgi:hypothetical protein